MEQCLGQPSALLHCSGGEQDCPRHFQSVKFNLNWMKVYKIHFKSWEQAVKPSLANQVFSDSDLAFNLLHLRKETEDVSFLAAIYSKSTRTYTNIVQLATSPES